uniref:Uncharacterized protein n=1 Tax=Mimiviridae sp. ChoanoV1 TaxID=2596887 RepID=A0A5B8HVS8_9VIRU|nr:hypothetical protein 4_79 [Mimiviridae sp. ChoanoV1]
MKPKSKNFKKKNIFKKKSKKINYSLYADYHPETSRNGLGYKNKEIAIQTIKKIKKQPLKYQKAVINTMKNRAKYHKYKTNEMKEAIKVFDKWLDKNK